MMKSTKSIHYQIFAAIATLPFFVLLYRYINADLYYDEVYSLIHYIFVPLKNTVVFFKDINNHFLSNLINNLYLKLIGEESLHTLMDHPWFIRIVQLGYTIITLTIFYHLCRKHFNRDIALFSIILLTTSTPFYNYALQVRGYNLSITLLCFVLLFLWNFERDFRRKDGILLAVSCALLIYSLLSNLYTLLGIMIFYFFEGVIKYIFKFGNNKKKDATRKKIERDDPQLTFSQKNRELLILCILGCGLLLSIILYGPLIKGLVVDPNIAGNNKSFNMPIIVEIMPSIFHAFLSWRYVVGLLSIIGFFFCFVKTKKYEKEFIRKALFCALVIVTPLITSFVRGDSPWERFFLNPIPAFCLLLSIGLYFFFKNMIKKSNFIVIAVFLFLYSNITFYCGVRHISNRLLHDITNGETSVTLLYNYWQAHYSPLKLLRFFTSNYQLPKYKGACTLLIVEKCDRAATPAYLNKFKYAELDSTVFRWSFATEEKWETFTSVLDTMFVLTAYPYKFEGWFKGNYPDFNIARQNEHLQYQNIFLITRIMK
ncbi:glycosyltransferase family 39 protein [Candidatus Latescibacterota bacterium]